MLKVIGFELFELEALFFENSNNLFKITGLANSMLYKSFFFKLNGVGYRENLKLSKYLELNKNISFDNFTYFQKYIFFFYFLHLYPMKLDFSNRKLFNIWVLHYLFTYKGWRHFFDLPVNGQRTWSNNKTQFRLNNRLREYQMNCFKLKFGITAKTNLRMSFLAEYINLFWFLEWNSEWLSANETFKKTKKKTKYFRLRINYRHLLNLQITTPKSIEHKKKKKNRKKVKNEFTIGFDSLYVVSLFSKKKYLFKHLF